MMMLRIILNIASDDTGSQRGPSLSAIKPPQRGEESLGFPLQGSAGGAARGGARVATAVHRCAPREGGSVFGIE